MIYDKMRSYECENPRSIQEKKNIWHSGIKPGSFGHMSTTISNERRGLSLQSLDARYLEHALVDFKRPKT